MSTDVAQENPPIPSVLNELANLGKSLLAKHLSLKPGEDIPPEDRIEPVDSIRAGIGAKFLAQDGVSPETLGRLSIYDLRVLFDVYQGNFRGAQLVDYIGRVPDSSILLGQGFKQLVDQGMAPVCAPSGKGELRLRGGVAWRSRRPPDPAMAGTTKAADNRSEQIVHQRQATSVRGCRGRRQIRSRRSRRTGSLPEGSGIAARLSPTGWRNAGDAHTLVCASHRRGPPHRSSGFRASEPAGANMARRSFECQDARDDDMKQFAPAVRMPR